LDAEDRVGDWSPTFEPYSKLRDPVVLQVVLRVSGASEGFG
jgi:hypothetical protein